GITQRWPHNEFELRAGTEFKVSPVGERSWKKPSQQHGADTAQPGDAMEVDDEGQGARVRD
ncbi:unnamed protein product, partial [Amoebophrya sp. A120]